MMGCQGRLMKRNSLCHRALLRSLKTTVLVMSANSEIRVLRIIANCQLLCDFNQPNYPENVLEDKRLKRLFKNVE